MGIRHDAVTVFGNGFQSSLGDWEEESCRDQSQETCLYAEFQIRSLRIVFPACCIHWIPNRSLPYIRIGICGRFVLPPMLEIPESHRSTAVAFFLPLEVNL